MEGSLIVSFYPISYIYYQIHGQHFESVGTMLARMGILSLWAITLISSRILLRRRFGIGDYNKLGDFGQSGVHPQEHY